MTEQQPYQVLAVLPGFELRNYPAHLVAQVTVHSSIEAAGNTAFRYLFGYISGKNRSNPLDPSQDPAIHSRPVKIPMTAPVVLHPQTLDETYTVAFVLPETLSTDTAPDPDDPAVTIVAMPESRGAAASFSGRWTSRNYLDHAAALGEAVSAAGLTPLGLPRFALFDPPYRPWFLRRNEVVQTVE
ncbi:MULTISPECIES: heme-binding protein [unclassified Arthrobacter]|uniref:SOUL family heme-binding protein n=1 Tax=unclassified Arthrobacter TaxID=235627 RepID=UPI000CE33CD8|nr:MULTISPECIES: heme-binding protein [unclassified Arthrobacter]